MMIACGVDSGARATKVVLLDDAARIVSSSSLPTGGSAQRSADRALSEALSLAGLSRGDISAVTATGYGRGSLSADERLTEITCHARGAVHSVPGARTVLDVGGQDAKFISLDENAEAADFLMNDRCAAGTGRFLEVISGILGVGVDQLSDLALSSASPAPVASVCVVFAESEVVSLIGQGRPPSDIAAGVLKSMAGRMKGLMGHLPPRRPAVFVGGVARNDAFATALREQSGLDYVVPDRPHLNGALGAALFSLEKLRDSGIQVR